MIGRNIYSNLNVVKGEGLDGSGTVEDPYAPMRNMIVTGQYGYRIYSFVGLNDRRLHTLRMHSGVDTSSGDTSFYAMVNGQVSLAWRSKYKGLDVKFQFQENHALYYGHNGLSVLDLFAFNALANNGFTVEAGTKIGFNNRLSPNENINLDKMTGFSTGPHIHLEYYIGRNRQYPNSLYNFNNDDLFDNYARYMTGYESTNVFNRGLAQNVYCSATLV